MTNIDPVSPELRLSALRAFLGRIPAQVRLIKCKSDKDHIRVTILVDSSIDEGIQELLSEASTEIIADFPGMKITEEVLVVTGPIRRENLLAEGWIYCRHEE